MSVTADTLAMLGGLLLKAMEAEHRARHDKDKPFDTSNGMKGVISALEWEFVVTPNTSHPSVYVERGGTFQKEHPDWCRKPEPLSVYREKMRDINCRLRKAGQAELIEEELIAGRL